MRVTRLRDDESGAVLVFVAVCLVVLLGMTALTVDLGRAVAIKRDMVNAADAAALAGADVCATEGSVPAARAAAENLSELNGADDRFSFSAPRCGAVGGSGARTVTVTSRTRVDYFIAPILGFDGTDVVASATAEWVPTGARNPVPFVADVSHTRSDCGLDNASTPIDTPCYFWFDNDDFSGSTFGTLNLNAWGVSADEAGCANKELGANAHYAAIGGYDGPELPPLPEDGSGVYVCAATGNAQPMYTSLAEAKDKIIALPVTDGCVTQGSHCETFHVIDFTRVLLTGVFRANEAPAECGPPPANGSATCITTLWKGRGRGTDDPNPNGTGTFYDIRLVS